ncbi:Hint domain-containing protein [Primorskyibacter sp. S87]|uniref:Hint domain-containing protein n=1 Tax=Primorskyibacter sp. S87 TaxID=3415126 RepID=UPI003C7C240A
MLAPGALMFVGWDADNEDVAFVTTEAIAPEAVIYFTDSEWNGSNFLAGEQLIEWTVPASGIAAGTVLTLEMTPGGGAVVTETGDLGGSASGSIDYIQGGGMLAQGNEMMWAFQGTRVGDDVTPENFIAVIGNEADGGNRATPNLNGTGLTEQNGAIIIDGDHDFMVFDGFDTLPDPISGEGAIAAISDTSNWTLAGPGFNGANNNPNPDLGFDLTPVRLYDSDDVTTLYFNGDHVAFFDDVSSPDNDVTTEISVEEQPFLPTDIVEIDILNSSIRSDGEFDFDEVIFTRVAVTRGGVTYEFDVKDGSKVKESGATESDSGQAVEQGDSFFTTNDEVESLIGPPRDASPFSGLPEGKMVFALNATFVDGQVTSIVREQGLVDENGDAVGTVNANFYTGLSEVPPVPCFVAGTLIETVDGPRPVETLQAGDLVLTRDNGPQAIRWTGGRQVPARDTLRPIRIRAGAYGTRRDLMISPQHKMLVSGWKAELLFGENEVLVAAKHLVDDISVRPASGLERVSYHHLLFDRHEVIYAEGAETESLDPACVSGWDSRDPAKRELNQLFPELFGATENLSKTVRKALKSHEGHLLAR